MTAKPTIEENEIVIEEQKKPFKHKKLIIALSIFLTFVIVFVSAFFTIIKIGEANLRKKLVSDENINSELDNFDENAVYYNGEAYYYNEDLINILLIGIDEAQYSDDLAQADALYLVSIDTKKNNVNVTSISRNTLAEMDVYDAEGEVYGTEKKQVCLAYAYGSDDIKSSKNCVKSVSKILYNIPINGYYTLYLNSLIDIVDSVGGISVVVPEDSTDPWFAERIGQTVSLNGEYALRFLQMRGDSNIPRMERHKSFIKSFISSAKTAVKKNVTLPFKMADKLSKKSVTNINVSSMVYLGIEALNWQLKFSNIAGENKMVDGYELFLPDEEKLRETVLNNFYIKK